MKSIVLLLAVAFVAMGCTKTARPVASSVYDAKLVHVLEQLRACTLEFDERLPMVGGPAVGYAGRPHEFYLLSQYVSTVARDEDLRAMLRDESPVVRIMAAQCILKKEDATLRSDLDGLATDSARVFVAPFGCSILKQSVAEVVAELKKDSDYLSDPKPPNQALQPTAPSGRG